MIKNDTKKIILSVDDDAIFREVIRNDLTKMGLDFDYHGVEDGNVAMRTALELMNQPTGLDLIICDWNMPNVSGLEFFNLIRQNKNLKTIPFLMLTSVNTKIEVLKAMKAGIKHYMVKPWTYENFEVKVKAMLNLDQQS